ncbi:hypothetical protein EC991_006290 [Linnemannia zychae]|nr:hypothetical protein EC991_006290 [Linnemannia zychae]
MEECDEKATLGIALTKTAVIIQGGSVNKTAKTMKLLEDGSSSQDKSTGVSRQKRKLKDAILKDTRTQVKVVGEGRTSKRRSLEAGASNNLHGACDSAIDTSSSRGLQLHFDVQLMRSVTLTLAGFDVGAAFGHLQERTAPFIND